MTLTSTTPQGVTTVLPDSGAGIAMITSSLVFIVIAAGVIWAGFLFFRSGMAGLRRKD